MFKNLVITFAAATLLYSCSNKDEKIHPVEEKITESVYASGIIKSKNQNQAFATVPGIIKEIYVTEGDKVKKGDKLMLISNTTAQLNTESAGIAAEYSSLPFNKDKLNELKIAIDLANDKMANDASLLDKQNNLWKQGIGTRNDVDQRELALKNSTTAYNSAKLRYNEMEKQLEFQDKQSKKTLEISKHLSEDYIIKSEVDGKVFSVLKEKGEMANVQAPLALIGDESGFYLELQVDEYDIARVIPGQRILLNMDSYKGQVFEGTVEKIDPAMNPQSKSFTVEARFTSPPPTLYPNLTTEANIIIRVKDKALTIPRSYLTDDGYVMLASKEKRKVNTGLKDYQKVEITGGLTTADEIIKPAR